VNTVAAQPDAAAAALRKTRQTFPDLAFVCNMLPPQPRHDVAVLWAVADQLREILETDDHCDDGHGCGLPQAMCCGGEHGDKHLAVCEAVVDHLLAGELTGRADLDGFADVAARHDISRDELVAAVAAWSTLRALPRVATWNRLRDQLAASVGTLSQLAIRLVADDALTETQAAQSRMLGVAAIAATWPAFAANAAQRDALLWPLDDLHAIGLADRAALADLKACNVTSDAWTDLHRRWADRAAKLLDGCRSLLTVTADGRSRRAVAIALGMIRTQLDRLAAGRPDRPRLLRLRGLAEAFRLMMR